MWRAHRLALITASGLAVAAAGAELAGVELGGEIGIGTGTSPVTSADLGSSRGPLGGEVGGEVDDSLGGASAPGSRAAEAVGAPLSLPAGYTGLLRSFSPQQGRSTRDGTPAIDPRGANEGAHPVLPSVPPRVHLLAVFERPVDPLVAVVGVDEAGPRDVVVWQVDESRGTASPVHRLRSESDGSFAAERMLLSQRGVRLVAAPVGEDPFGPHASDPIDFVPRENSPSQENP